MSDPTDVNGVGHDEGGQHAPFGDLPEDTEREAIATEAPLTESERAFQDGKRRAGGARELGDDAEAIEPGYRAPTKAQRLASTHAALSPSDVVDQWKADGPLVHEPTGIAELDALTGGGPVYGTRWYWLGAPDAGKTAELVQIADRWSQDGRVVCGYLAVDEEPSDITTRLVQRRKFRRDECEARDAAALTEMKAALGESQLRLYGPDWTIDSAASDLVAYATRLGKADRVALFVDSIQQVTCADLVVAEREVSPREVVSANVRALRFVATTYRLIAMATSEMNRNAYRSIESAEQSNDMAAGKESGAIEFSARVMLSLRSVKGEKDMTALRVVKNKHGPSGDEIHRRIDRRHMTIETTEAPVVDDPTESRNDGKRAGRIQAASRLADFLTDHQGIGTRDLRAGLRTRFGSYSTDLIDDAGTLLGTALLRSERTPGKPTTHFLDGSKLSEEVVSALPSERRGAVICARPDPERAGAKDE